MTPRNLILISGGPDALAELVFWLDERPMEPVDALYIAPTPSQNAVLEQIETLAWLGYTVPFHMVHVLPIAGVDPIISAAPAIVAFAKKHGCRLLVDGTSQDDDTNHWMRVDAALSACARAIYSQGLEMFTAPVFAAKQVVRDFLGPLWGITESCLHGPIGCGRCKKCHQRNRTIETCEPLKSKSPESWRASITRWRSSATFKASRENMLTGHGWQKLETK